MPKKRKPSYLLHKSTGQARVRVGGKDLYLGPYGSPESLERYDELIAEWFAQQGEVDCYSLTVDDLCILFVEFAKTYYRKNGQVTAEVSSIQHALRPLVKLYGTTRARGFGPKKLKAVRQHLIKAGHVRTNINRMIERIRRMFKWATSEELLPVEVYQALCTVQGLRKGRSEAKESDPVLPVDDKVVNKTLPYLSSPVAAMVKLQRLTGARPGEISILRPCDITKQSGVWMFIPESHKTEHHGKERRIYIGPKAQRVLKPYLHRDPESYCFSPTEAEAERNAERRANRKSPMTPSQAKRKPAKNRKWPPKERYTKDSYCRAIRRACEKAKVQPWAPNQLRHSKATLIREKFGIEAAQVVLGHSDPKVTEIYAERDFEMAARVMKEIG